MPYELTTYHRGELMNLVAIHPDRHRKGEREGTTVLTIHTPEPD